MSTEQRNKRTDESSKLLRCLPQSFLSDGQSWCDSLLVQPSGVWPGRGRKAGLGEG